ncbi:Transmembrane osmosensor [Coemansia erecta]|nr:Transmembrane osmosensor [Coemansia sp. RSA 2618]KAJ2821983.1 Transmembrane osmosensor [Coemansia erecta]
MGFRLKRVFSSPIFIGTLALIFAGLAVTLVCACLKTVYIVATTWFMIVYLFMLAFALLLTICTNTLHKYRLALLAMISIGLSLNVGHIGYYINATVGVLQAMSAGLIFVEITLFFWVLILGSGPGTYLADLCGTGADGKGNTLPMADMSMARKNYRQTMNSSTNAATGASTVTDYYSSELNQSVMSGKPRDSSAGVYKARALYAYDANPDDPNEVSIAKDEVMLVIDDSGKWWQVKKDDGTVGIAPSNYITRILSQ